MLERYVMNKKSKKRTFWQTWNDRDKRPDRVESKEYRISWNRQIKSSDCFFFNSLLKITRSPVPPFTFLLKKKKKKAKETLHFRHVGWCGLKAHLWNFGKHQWTYYSYLFHFTYAIEESVHFSKSACLTKL